MKIAHFSPQTQQSGGVATSELITAIIPLRTESCSPWAVFSWIMMMMNSLNIHSLTSSLIVKLFAYVANTFIHF